MGSVQDIKTLQRFNPWPEDSAAEAIDDRQMFNIHAAVACRTTSR